MGYWHLSVREGCFRYEFFNFLLTVTPLLLFFLLFNHVDEFFNFLLIVTHLPFFFKHGGLDCSKLSGREEKKKSARRRKVKYAINKRKSEAMKMKAKKFRESVEGKRKYKSMKEVLIGKKGKQHTMQVIKGKCKRQYIMRVN